MVGFWVTSSYSCSRTLKVLTRTISFPSLRPTIYYVRSFLFLLSSFPGEKVSACETDLLRSYDIISYSSIHDDNVTLQSPIISTLIVISHHQSQYWSAYYIWLFQRLLSFQPSSQGASDEHTGRFPAGFALVYMIIYHALALYESGSDVAGVRGWLRTP